MLVITKNINKRTLFTGNKLLQEVDPEVYQLNQEEIKRQFQSLELIASENFASHASLSALSSHFNNKYSEGYPGARYYGGTQVVDKLEQLCQKRALQAFHLDPNIWGVNVQALSGSPANLAVYTALVPPNGRIMGLNLSDGGHLTHGYRNKNRSVSASSLFWQSLPYIVNQKTQLIDYDELDHNAKLFNPHLIIAGASAYPRNIDYSLMRKTADSTGSILMADMAHISGLVSAGIIPSPFDHCDIVTTTTHKTLRSVRGALIFYKKKYEKAINLAVFPGLQGGPHMHQIAAIAVSLKEALTPEFKKYQEQTLKNMKALSLFLMKNKIDLVSGGTDNHLALLDLRKHKIDGARLEYLLDCANITTNKNTIPGDKNAGMPKGLRIGSPALTTRGLLEKDFEKVGEFIIEGIQHTKRIKKATKKLNEFKKVTSNDEKVKDLKKRVIEFATKFDLPGVFDPKNYL
ncbi:serine hydroxymethyltransferase, cytosolic [Histomonas meleagridis]|uniref:serine hydroxymethyltransferase, cytosolic n=1 Tax=Histomonas meleagridis TaxID=135588 RepID=UPI0035594D55|nr:serine hydroxymethyltransferase, cytosolic [Histomonas meleagridis]KAH0798455.1 serine hydroxymethyltransferase, cytosolic [Histomonas meleagridis]